MFDARVPMMLVRDAEMIIHGEQQKGSMKIGRARPSRCHTSPGEGGGGRFRTAKCQISMAAIQLKHAVCVEPDTCTCIGGESMGGNGLFIHKKGHSVDAGTYGICGL